MAKRQISSQEIGSISRSLFNRLSDTEYLSLLTWPNSTYIYDKMRRSDAQVQALLFCMELPIRSTRWYVEPWNKNNPKDVQIAEFIEENLFSGPPRGMTSHWDDFLRLALLMLPFGHSIFEKVYEVDSHGYAKWRKFAERPHETIKDFKYDERGGPLHVEQYVAGASFVEIPIDSSLIFTHRKEGGRLHGISVLRAAYKHWFIKDFLLKITNIGIEKNHVGTPVTKLPENLQDGDREEAEKITRNLRSGEDAGVVLPYGFELEMFEGKRVAIEVLPYIRYQDEMIAKAGLAHFLQLGTGTTGSFALGKDQSDFFLMALNAQSKYLCDVINSYAIPQLVDLNWDVEGYPYLKCDKLGGRDVDGIIKGTTELTGGSIILPDQGLEEFMRDLLGLPEIDEKTKRGGPMAIPPVPPVAEPKKASEPKKFAEMTWRRDLTKYEQRINLSEIDQKFDTAEAEFVAQGLGLTLEQLSVFLTQAAALAAAGKWDEIVELTIDGAALTAYIISFLAEMFGFGAGQAAEELGTESPDMPDDVKQITALKAATVTDKVMAVLQAVAVFELLNAVESGQKPKDAVKDIKKTLENAAKKDLEGHATVQTAWGVNAGRDYVAGEAGVKRIQYSAILDRRTCVLCKKLDGMILEAGTPEAKKFKPPIHSHCYSYDTEVYTSEGWKLFNELTGDEEILSLTPETHLIEWANINNKIAFHHDGIVYNLKSKSLDLSVTPKHSMYIGKRVDRGCIGKQTEWLFVDAHELTNMQEWYLLRTGKWNGARHWINVGSLKVKPESYAEFMGYYLSEGSTTQRTKNGWQISIAQKDPRFMYDRIKNMNLPGLTVNIGREKIYIFGCDWGKHLSKYGHSHQKYVPKTIKAMTPDIINIFLNAYCEGDGSIKQNISWPGKEINEKPRRAFFTSSKKMADDLGELILKFGKGYPSFYLDKTKGKYQQFKNGKYIINNDIWRIEECHSQKACYSRSAKYGVTINESQYSNMVYCVELNKNHILWVRRGGKPVWSGNCRCIYAYVLPEEQPQPKVNFVPPPEDLIEKHGHLVTR